MRAASSLALILLLSCAAKFLLTCYATAVIREASSWRGRTVDHTVEVPKVGIKIVGPETYLEDLNRGRVSATLKTLHRHISLKNSSFG